MTNINKTELNAAVKAAETKLYKVIEGLQNRVVEAENSNKELRELVSELRNELNQIKKKPAENLNVANWATVVSRNAKKPEEQLVVVNAAINEQKDRERRKKNVIIFGIPETGSNLPAADKVNEDNNKVEKLLKDIDSNAKPCFIKRLRSKNQDKPGPLLVVLSDQSERNPLLLAAKKLRNSTEYKSVYISPDLTEAERLEDYKLRKKRDELNTNREANAPFRFAIRGNGIVKLKLQAAEFESHRSSTN